MTLQLFSHAYGSRSLINVQTVSYNCVHFVGLNKYRICITDPRFRTCVSLLSRMALTTQMFLHLKKENILKQKFACLLWPQQIHCFAFQLFSFNFNWFLSLDFYNFLSLELWIQTSYGIQFLLFFKKKKIIFH